MPSSANVDSYEDEKFAFGKNWSEFIERLGPERIEVAKQSLVDLLKSSVESSDSVPDSGSNSGSNSGPDSGSKDWLQGKRFLDAGSGSGLFSLAAHQMGASVVSFDADADSVGCTRTLCEKYSDQSQWYVRSGSLLDADFMDSLGTYDIVYCWGVAHHTGQMWTAIDHLCDRVAEDGTIVLAIYNDQGYVSQIWGIIKRTYKRLPEPIRPVFAGLVGLVLLAKRFAITLLASFFRVVTLKNPIVPFQNWIRETQGRGMHVWNDLVDWVGGWPFEVAQSEQIFRDLRDRGFELRELVTCGGHGCNEFVFRNQANHRDINRTSD